MSTQQVMESNSASESPTVTPLYVCDLDTTVTEEQLYDVFSSVGEVSSVRVCRDHISQVSLGYGYVNYSNPQDARKALQSLNFKPINGKCVWIMLSDGDRSIQKSEDANVFISNVAPSLDAKSLQEGFSFFGTVLWCRLDYNANRCVSNAFIQFDREEAAEAAILALDKMGLNGTQVRVSHFMCKQERNRAEIPHPDRTVFVKYMSGSVQEEYLESVFAPYGTITSTRVLWDDDGCSKCGFVVFEKSDAAKSAIEKLDGYYDDDDDEEAVWYVGWAKVKSERRDEMKAKIEPEKDSKLENLQGDASKTVKEMNGEMIGQKPLYVAMDEDERKEERRACQERQACLQVMETNSASESPTVTPLYVCDLDTTVTEKQLYDVFSSVGEVLSVRVCRDHISQVSLGYGYVNYRNPQDARKALQSLDFKPINGKCVWIMLSDGDRSIQKSEDANVFISNVAPSIDAKSLQEGFSCFGTVLWCRLDYNAKRCVSNAFIQFDREEAAEAAILALDKMGINGTQVRVSHFMCKQERNRAEMIPHPDRTVFVKYMSGSVQEEYLESVFAPYGTITSTRVVWDDDGCSKCGFVIFDKSDAAKSAILDGYYNDDDDEVVWYVGWAKVKAKIEPENLQGDAVVNGQKPAVYVAAMDERKEERRRDTESGMPKKLRRCEPSGY